MDNTSYPDAPPAKRMKALDDEEILSLICIHVSSKDDFLEGIVGTVSIPRYLKLRKQKITNALFPEKVLSTEEVDNLKKNLFVRISRSFFSVEGHRHDFSMRFTFPTGLSMSSDYFSVKRILPDIKHWVNELGFKLKNPNAECYIRNEFPEVLDNYFMNLVVVIEIPTIVLLDEIVSATDTTSVISNSSEEENVKNTESNSN